jgi:hypothetical protein
MSRAGAQCKRDDDKHKFDDDHEDDDEKPAFYGRKGKK